LPHPSMWIAMCSSVFLGDMLRCSFNDSRRERHLLCVPKLIVLSSFSSDTLSEGSWENRHRSNSQTGKDSRIWSLQLKSSFFSGAMNLSPRFLADGSIAQTCHTMPLMCNQNCQSVQMYSMYLFCNFTRNIPSLWIWQVLFNLAARNRRVVMRPLER
jgi:hypothetical protein